MKFDSDDNRTITASYSSYDNDKNLLEVQMVDKNTTMAVLLTRDEAKDLVDELKSALREQKADK